MDIVRAFTYSFDDRDWVNKIILTAIITAASILFTPVLIGLIGWAALLGYTIELVRNVRLGVRDPLPNWDDFARLIASGFNVLAALVVYSLPNLLLGCVSSILVQNMGGGLVGSTLVIGFSCCLFPLLLIYNLIAIPVAAVGIGRYTEDPRINVFFEFSYLYEVLRQHNDRLIPFWIAAIAADVVFVFLGIIPVLGWAVLAALLVPVYGMIAAQFSLIILGGLKGKPAPQPQPPQPRPQQPRR